MPPSPKPRNVRPTPAPPPAGHASPLRARYFRASADVNREIEAWAARSGARIRAIIPVHWEGVGHE